MQILNCKQAIVVGGPRWVLEGEGGGGGGHWYHPRSKRFIEGQDNVK